MKRTRVRRIMLGQSRSLGRQPSCVKETNRQESTTPQTWPVAQIIARSSHNYQQMPLTHRRSSDWLQYLHTATNLKINQAPLRNSLRLSCTIPISHRWAPTRSTSNLFQWTPQQRPVRSCPNPIQSHPMSITTQTYPKVSLSFIPHSKTTSSVTPILSTSVTSRSHILIARSPLNRISKLDS